MVLAYRHKRITPMNFIISVAVYSSLCILFVNGQKEYVVRETVYGKVRGFLATPIPGHIIEKFLAVPYAKPPLGKLRFEYPEEPIPWEDVVNATVLPPACTQIGTPARYIHDHVPNFNRSSEDCLYLNLHVPQTTNTKLPVFVYVHGGSNEAGMGAMFDGTVLAAFGEIIVLTFNYRLGAVGFLSTGSKQLPGNYGLLDQVLLLKWVQRNIHHFNGDPTKVTIDGHSAGAADVGFHVLSPLSKGLFRYAVIQSGSPVAYWAALSPETAPGYNLMPYVVSLGCTHNNGDTALKKCLQTISVDNLQNQPIYRKRGELMYFPPTVDYHFITDHAVKLLNNNALNGEKFMLGFTKDEGSKHAQLEFVRLGNQFSREHLKKTLLNYSVAFPKIEGLDKLILHEYTLWDDPENATGALLSYSELEGDLSITAPMIELATVFVRRNKPVYMYSFDYSSRLSPNIHWFGWYFPGMSLGVPHGRDLFYLFGYPLVGHPLYQYHEDDVTMSKMVMETWINFIKTGQPSNSKIELELYDDNKGSYTKFYQAGNETTAKIFYKYKPRKMHFWNELLPTLNKIDCGGSAHIRLNLLQIIILCLFALLLR